MTFFDVLASMQNSPYATLGYVLIFVLPFFESFPLIGAFLPSETTVIFAGFMSKLGVFNYFYVVFIVAIAIILGDFVGYFMGRKYGIRFLNKYGRFFLMNKPQIEKTEIFMRNHSGKAIVFGHFNSITRATVPFLAGSFEINLLRFFAYNVFGGVLSGFSFVSIGYFLGKGYNFILRNSGIGKYFLMAVFVSFAIIYFYIVSDSKQWDFAKKHFLMVIVNILSLYSFALILDGILDKNSIFAFDRLVNANMIHVWNPIATFFMAVITSLMHPLVFILMFSALLYYLYAKKRFRDIIFSFIMILGSFAFESLIKVLVHRARPMDAFFHVSSFSFPSGHATMSMALFILAVYIFRKDLKTRFHKISLLSSFVIIVSLIGFSRLFFAVHWFSDVFAGYLLSIFWFTFLVFVFDFYSFFRFQTLM